MKAALALITISTLTLLLGCPLVLALDPSLDVSQYAHTAWTVRDGFFGGAIFAMAQTPDGYLWLGSEFGLFRFDWSTDPWTAIIVSGLGASLAMIGPGAWSIDPRFFGWKHVEIVKK